MPLDDQTIDALIEKFGIAIDEQAVAEEAELRAQQRLHALKYEGLRTGSFADYYRAALSGADDSLLVEARRAVGLDALISRVIDTYAIEATAEELEAEADRIAEAEGASKAMVRGFFGEDLSLLKRDVLERKALDLLATL